jgi:hypothetical protein
MSLPKAGTVFEEANRVLDQPISRLYFEGREEHRKLQGERPAGDSDRVCGSVPGTAPGGIKLNYVAGHIVGEYSATARLVFAGME